MNTESKINVHHSSLLGLKAELLRKQVEIQVTKKVENVTTPKTKSKNEKINEKRKRKSKRKEKQGESEDIETIKALKKSKLMLEAKSRLYEKLTKTHTNMNPNFLVDFEHKSDESDQLEESNEDADIYTGSYSDSDDEWVEYTDCFGRTRKCLREDLPKMQKDDELLKQNVVRKSQDEEEVQTKPLFFEDRTPAKESEIDVLRKKWEEQTAKLAQKADIHYQDILFDEARTHGVGYYAFSQDDDVRAKQQENLLNLRKETEQKQKENQTMTEMKEKMQQNRLRLARIRKRIRAGLTAEEAEEAENSIAAGSQEENTKDQGESKEESSRDDDENNKSDQTVKQELAIKKSKDAESKIQAFGELLEKKNKFYVMSQEEWVDKKRKERDSEFAPLYANFQHGGSLNLPESAKSNSNHSNSSETIGSGSASFDDSDLIGPIPPTSDELYIVRAMQPDSNESDIIGPLPPTSNGSNIIGSIPSVINDSDIHKKTDCDVPETVNIEDQIEVGLKFLRQQFEDEHQ